MSNDKYDAETNAQLSRAQALEAMFGSSGWKYAQQDLFELIAELKNIETIDEKGDIAQQIRDRKNLAESLIEWYESLKSQVNNAIIMQEQDENKLVERR